jgi:carboxyl-terminal processing protease
MNRRRYVIWLIVLLLLSNALTYGLVTGQIPFVSRFVQPRVGPGAGEAEKLWRVMRLIEAQYIDKVPTDKLLEGAVSGMVKALEDAPSYYMTKSDWADFMIQTQGEYAGIGMQIQEQKVGRTSYVTVVRVFPGTPAESAGITKGDRIMKANGKDLVGSSADQVAQIIRGPEGTTVTVELFRDGWEKAREFKIVRARIVIPSVSWRKLEGGKIGYLQLSGFDQRTAAEVTKAIGQMADVKGMILDLRDNPGGLLDTAVEIAKHFVPSGPVVHVVDRQGNKKTSSIQSEGLKIPLVVLVNEFSASASEILAGSIQDAKSGVLIGTKTYGKGSVQRLFSLPGGTGVKLTTERWLTRNGRQIDKTSLTPDITSELPVLKAGEKAPELDDPKNPQLLKAIEVLKGLIAK